MGRRLQRRRRSRLADSRDSMGNVSRAPHPDLLPAEGAGLHTEPQLVCVCVGGRMQDLAAATSYLGPSLSLQHHQEVHWSWVGSWQDKQVRLQPGIGS